MNKPYDHMILTQHQQQIYKYICKRLDYILIKSKIRQKCIKCSQSKYKRLPRWLEKQGGCCTYCKSLGKNGCKSISIVCKLWFCNSKFALSKIEKYGFKKEWYDLMNLCDETLPHEYFRRTLSHYKIIK